MSEQFAHIVDGLVERLASQQEFDQAVNADSVVNVLAKEDARLELRVEGRLLRGIFVLGGKMQMLGQDLDGQLGFVKVEHQGGDLVVVRHPLHLCHSDVQTRMVNGFVFSEDLKLARVNGVCKYLFGALNLLVW